MRQMELECRPYRHPMYLTDKFLVHFLRHYEELEKCKLRYEHWVTLGAEMLTIEDTGGEGGELYVSIYGQKQLVIRRVVILNKRNGVFTALILELLELLMQTSITEVVIESVLTPEMYAWCRKHQFATIPGMFYNEEGLGGSYRIELTHLHDILLCETGHVVKPDK